MLPRGVVFGAAAATAAAISARFATAVVDALTGCEGGVAADVEVLLHRRVVVRSNDRNALGDVAVAARWATDRIAE